MSLLIKALEQAARDRDSTKRSASAKTEQPASTPFELEPAPAARAPRSDLGASAQVPETHAGKHVAAAAAAPDTARRSAPAAAMTQPDAQQQRARAASIVRAADRSGQVVVAFLRRNPVLMFGVVASVFAACFATYVYLQISQPNLFAKKTIAAQASLVPPHAATPQPPIASSAPSIAQLVATTDRSDPASNVTSQATRDMPQSADARPPETRTANSMPVAIASVVGDVSAEIPEARTRPDAANVRAGIGKGHERPRSGAAQAPPDPRIGPERIAVTPTLATPQVNPTLATAYAALQSGNLAEARELYKRVVQADPLNIDALLGSAYIAEQENRNDEATKLYVRILQINPRHAAAQGALIGLIGRADPIASETRLKQLIARDPSPFLHFVLGNLYADQAMWAQAQQAYFQAHHLEPDNPDYAYNVAIGLDHLRQSKLALGFYRRAEQLAASAARSNFDVTHARERIAALSAELD